MPVTIVSGSRHTGHAPTVEIQGGAQLPAFDRVERVATVIEALDAAGGYAFRPPTEHGCDPILRVHARHMIEALEHCWARHASRRPDGPELIFADTFLHARLREGLDDQALPKSAFGELGAVCFDTITGIGPRTYDAAREAADVALTAVDAVTSGERLALGLTRPPGHHVTRSLFGGGCFLNNAAIAAEALRDAGLARVAVLDLDYHHGNGTQSIFYARADVFFASLHGNPDSTYPYFTGWPSEDGGGLAGGGTVNVLLPECVDGARYRDLLAPVLARVSEFDPAALVVSLGVDTGADDPSGDGTLESSDFERIGADVGELGVPTVVVLEGGYRPETVGRHVASWMQGARSAAGLIASGQAHD